MATMTDAEQAAEADRANEILAVEARLQRLRHDLRWMGQRCYNHDAERQRDQLRARVIRETELPEGVEKLRSLRAGIGSGLRP